MSKTTIKKAYKSCNPLKNECIKEEIGTIIKGYTLNSIERQNKEFICSFTKETEETVLLIIKTNSLVLYKNTKNIVEKITVNDQPILIQKKIEKRPNGIIFSDIQKYFSNPSVITQKNELIDLSERRYVITKDTLERVLNTNFENINLNECLNLALNVDMNDYCAYKSEFSTNINYNWIKENSVCSTKTYVNGNPISGMYAAINGSKRLYRIHDLYNGITNQRNLQDISLMQDGLLRKESYDLKRSMGITTKEEQLVGKSLKTQTDQIFVKQRTK